MQRWKITCETCERQWKLPNALTIYEKRALEDHRCPHCGAYTLACRELEPEPNARSRALARTRC